MIRKNIKIRLCMIAVSCLASGDVTAAGLETPKKNMGIADASSPNTKISMQSSIQANVFWQRYKKQQQDKAAAEATAKRELEDALTEKDRLNTELTEEKKQLEQNVKTIDANLQKEKEAQKKIAAEKDAVTKQLHEEQETNQTQAGQIRELSTKNAEITKARNKLGFEKELHDMMDQTASKAVAAADEKKRQEHAVPANVNYENPDQAVATLLLTNARLGSLRQYESFAKLLGFVSGDKALGDEIKANEEAYNTLVARIGVTYEATRRLAEIQEVTEFLTNYYQLMEHIYNFAVDKITGAEAENPEAQANQEAQRNDQNIAALFN